MKILLSLHSSIFIMLFMYRLIIIIYLFESGIGLMQTNVNEMGERMSTYEAFLKPVIADAYVTKVNM